MKVAPHPLFWLFFLALSAVFTGCKEDTDSPDPDVKKGKVALEFENVVGDSPLELNSVTPYSTPSNEDFKVTIFRYYISNIKLKRADGTEFIQPNSYYLLDQAREASLKFTIPDVPVGNYNSLTFTLGVDTTRNTGGAQTGALAISDMFWTWDTGYIFTKMEGSSTQAPNKALVFHIGGNSNRKVVSPAMNNRVIQVRESRTPGVHVRADVLRMFTGPEIILFSKTNNVMGGDDAVRVAKNQAAGMFTVSAVDTEYTE
ncbi:MbnP family protein [Hymenobacter volaticus]|uniref:Copper-binding protein MbnP-like domain-containing protein n=1 Tax=Hymenobacter volaticus TaxID=2932254 RepID=A0ABY4GAB9_9BACT|nr:MbnP family protein [Hymenobacter volaticus]UOQ67519.1 hypothetical protein MUN86_06490 [Hymenobacter volaticus]